MKKTKNNIGILGGTFDPPHKGHLKISEIPINKLKLSKLFWVITKKNPFKQKPYFSIIDRIKRSKNITKKNKNNSIYSVVGGGDTIALINKINVIENFNFVSTAGGAFLEYLEGKEIPGIKALN